MTGPSITINEVAAESADTIRAVTRAAYMEYEETTHSSALLETS